MWCVGVVVLVFTALVTSAPHGDENGLLLRLKRSYCPPGPPGPPPPPPPLPPPHFHHHHFGAYSQANAQAGYGRLTQDQGQNYQDFSQGNNYQGQGNDYQGQGNVPCDTCKGQNSAVSNAQSGTGNAVAIAVSKG